MAIKKTIIISVLLILNLLLYYYLTEYVRVNITFEEMLTILIISLICLPMGVLLPSTFIYALKSSNEKFKTPFKNIFLSFYFNTAIGFYSVMLLIATLIYLKVSN